MSVIVKDMDIPRDCDECWHPRCNLWLQTDIGKRHEACPITTMPKKHGRLIDLDALWARIYGEERPEMYDGMDEVSWINQCLEDAPIIVEAEG